MRASTALALNVYTVMSKKQYNAKISGATFGIHLILWLCFYEMKGSND